MGIEYEGEFEHEYDLGTIARMEKLFPVEPRIVDMSVLGD
jgi:hypothetical protein